MKSYPSEGETAACRLLSGAHNGRVVCSETGRGESRMKSAGRRGQRRIGLLAISAALSCMLFPEMALSQSKVTVPANVGVGPVGAMPFGPIFRDQPVHPGLKIWIGAVLDQKTIRENIHRVPAAYRQQARQMDELRIGAHILIPDSLILSPKLGDTGILGVTWRPISLGMPLARTDGFRAGLSAGAILTYAFIWSDTLSERYTNFLRPGIDLKAEMEIKLHPKFLVSLGWTSQLHLPQELGPNPFAVEETFLEELPGSLSRAIWHIGQPFLMLHYRFPFETSM